MCWTISWLCIVAFWSLHRLLGNLTPMTRLQEVSAPNGPRKGTIKGPLQCTRQGSCDRERRPEAAAGCFLWSLSNYTNGLDIL